MKKKKVMLIGVLSIILIASFAVYNKVSFEKFKEEFKQDCTADGLYFEADGRDLFCTDIPPTNE
ncbi:hypothetical protein [Bacillus solimangrovi]|uniref:Uncharacterized protein n=1 Tax=Bacillus solimangrovi TaxID=1305675 RepID=A0A1E5LJG2_9BACI|nr:hypothetical protein [Bacillus solimangrovi]OEH94233.1 hypothetical protein BFG57_09295 [Bacillus solimangrovi]